MTAWTRLEGSLRSRWDHEKGRSQQVDAAGLLTWARRTGILSLQTHAFLDQCRKARNAYAHVNFEGYSGPSALPPREVVERLERVTSALAKPPKVTSVSVKADVCQANTPVLEALTQMRQHDFSQLPYQVTETQWRLITREQVARWVELSAEPDAACLLDLGIEVQALAHMPSIRPVAPIVVSRATLLADAVSEMVNAIGPRDDVETAQVLLVVDERASQVGPEIMALEDLPRAYEILGR